MESQADLKWPSKVSVGGLPFPPTCHLAGAPVYEPNPFPARLERSPCVHIMSKTGRYDWGFVDWGERINLIAECSILNRQSQAGKSRFQPSKLMVHPQCRRPIGSPGTPLRFDRSGGRYLPPQHLGRRPPISTRWNILANNSAGGLLRAEDFWLVLLPAYYDHQIYDHRNIN